MLTQNPEMKLTLKEDSSSQYPPRTEHNVLNADITLAVAINLSTGGEKLTRDLCRKHEKPYVSVNPREVAPWDFALNVMRKLPKLERVTINVAGNGIYTMKNEMTQEQCNGYMVEVFREMQKLAKFSSEFGMTYVTFSVRSGGQTGFDTAGLVAALKLGWEAEGYYPKGYRVRTMEEDKYLGKQGAYEFLKSMVMC